MDHGAVGGRLVSRQCTDICRNKWSEQGHFIFLQSLASPLLEPSQYPSSSVDVGMHDSVACTADSLVPKHKLAHVRLVSDAAAK